MRLRGLAMIVVLLGLCARPGLAAVADEPASATFDAKGVKIHYLVQGEGAGRLDCIMKPQFRDVLTEWIAKQKPEPPAEPPKEAPKRTP